MITMIGAPGHTGNEITRLLLNTGEGGFAADLARAYAVLGSQ